MAISFMITLWLGIYLDNVLPSAYGLRKPWYFCFTSTYWFGPSNNSSNSSINREKIHQKVSTNTDIENVEDL